MKLDVDAEYARFMKDERIAGRYEEVLDRIVPAHVWNSEARADLRRLLARDILAVEKLFSPGDMDDFLHDYNRWNGDQADDLGDRSEKFLRKAARLGVARALALMLLLTDKQHPLTPEPLSAEGDVPF